MFKGIVLSEEVHVYMDAFKDDFLSESCSECFEASIVFCNQPFGCQYKKFLYIYLNAKETQFFLK